ncbi:MAG: MFS transporter, partial [Pyrinomonadaceae bacterium]|nr:MFS transporter [Pyrinomonadaceae bacterium]
LTNSSAMVGYIALAEFFPMFFLAFVGGALADAFDKRKILRITEIGQTLTTGILLVNSLLPTPQVWLIFVAAAFHAGFAAIQRPAFESYIQKVVPKEQMTAVMALNSMRWSIGAIISPAIAGVITTSFGVSVAFGIDFVSFSATLISVFMLNYVASPENADKPSLKGVFAAWRYGLTRQYLLGTYLIDIMAMFFAFPQALYPALATVYGKQYIGFFPAAIAFGALSASLTSGWTKFIYRHGLMVTIVAIFWGVAIMLFGFANNLWLALLFLAFAGFFDMLSGIFRGAVWNQTIPNHLRGRMASIEMISYLTGPYLGSAKMGIVAEKYGLQSALVSGGILCVIAIAVTALFLPKFLKYDGRDGIKQREYEEKLRESGFVKE